MAAGEPYGGKSSTDLSDGFILKGWAVEPFKSNPISRSNSKNCEGKDKEGLKQRTSISQSKYHGYWEKEELCFAFKHFQELDKYIEQYRQEKFRIQENYYKDALSKVRRQNSVLDDFINNQKLNYGVVLENSGQVNNPNDKISSSNFGGQSARKSINTGSNAASGKIHSSLTGSLQGGMKPKASRLKTGLLWKRSISDPSLAARLRANELESESNWTVVGVEKCPVNQQGTVRKTVCHSAPPKNTLSRFNSRRSYVSLQRTPNTFPTERKHPSDGRRKNLEINLIKPDLSAISENKASNSNRKQSIAEINQAKLLCNSPGRETVQSRRPVVKLNNLGDTFITGVGVGGSDSVNKSTKALPKRESLKSNKSKGKLGYVSSKSNYTDLFQHVICQYNENTMETESKLLSIKNF